MSPMIFFEDGGAAAHGDVADLRRARAVAVGSPGGSSIIGTVLNVVLDMIVVSAPCPVGCKQSVVVLSTGTILNVCLSPHA